LNVSGLFSYFDLRVVFIAVTVLPPFILILPGNKRINGKFCARPND
jgi:hypothetical protein